MTETAVAPSARDQTRAQIVEVAADLLAEGGRDAVTTRAVTTAAGVQAPTLYRLFGDKAGLLDAVAEHGFAAYLSEKAPPDSAMDPVELLRAGWDLHIGFGLAHPALYSLMYGEPHPGVQTPAAEAAFGVLRQHVRHVAEAGRLRVSEEHAAQLIHASGSGTVFALLTQPERERDLGLSALAREACLAAITTDATSVEEPGPVGAAVALRAALPDVTALSEVERGLLAEWLDRVAGQANQAVDTAD